MTSSLESGALTTRFATMIIFLFITRVLTFDPLQVVVDDSPTKLRGQPDSLVLSPEFDYPLEPSPQTSQILLDTFLLQLVGALDELQLESNFANYIFQNGWAKGFGTHAQDLQKSGVRVLKNDKINIMAEARGEVMVPYHERRLHFKIGTTVVAPPALKTSHPSVGLPGKLVSFERL